MTALFTLTKLSLNPSELRRCEIVRNTSLLHRRHLAAGACCNVTLQLHFVLRTVLRVRSVHHAARMLQSVDLGHNRVLGTRNNIVRTFMPTYSYR